MTRVGLLVGVMAALAVGCGDDGKQLSASGTATATATAEAGSGGSAATAGDTSVCNYYFEWLDRVRFPLQADPHAAYSYVIPKVSPASDHIGFTVKGPAPYAPWTSWMVYTGKAQPYSVVDKGDITPDPGHVNPWSGAPTPISAPNRDFSVTDTSRRGGPELDCEITSEHPGVERAAQPERHEGGADVDPCQSRVPGVRGL